MSGADVKHDIRVMSSEQKTEDAPGTTRTYEAPAPPIATQFIQDGINPLVEQGEPVPIPDMPVRNIPPANYPVDEDESAWEWLKGKFRIQTGMQIGGELNETQIKFTEDGSKIAGNVLSAVLGLLFSIGGPEYEVLAPSEELAYKMVLPAARVYARHSNVITEISPDYVDASACIAAVAEYATVVWNGIREIRRLKEEGYVYQGHQGPAFQTQGPTEQPEPQRQQREPERPVGRYADHGEGRTSRGFRITNTEYVPAPQEVQGNVHGDGQPDILGPAAYAAQFNGGDAGNRNAGTKSNADLTAEQRYQYEKLRELSRKDLQHRLRRAGNL